MKLQTVNLKWQVYAQELKEDMNKRWNEDKENTGTRSNKIGKAIQETFAV